MSDADILKRLRAVDEYDVARALDGAYVKPPLSEPAALVEFFQRVLDVTVGVSDGSGERGSEANEGNLSHGQS